MTVVLYVRLCCFGCVVRSVLQVTVCGVRVVRRRQMIVGLVVFGGFAMVTSRVVVMLSCFVVVLGCLFGHRSSLAGTSAEGRDGNDLV
jgi:hypothetical protein